MFIISNILLAIATVLHWGIWAYTIILIISALVSWVRPDPYSPVMRVLRGLTEPVLWRVRRKLPFVYSGGIDFSPLLLILALQFVDIALVQSLGELAVRLR